MKIQFYKYQLDLYPVRVMITFDQDFMERESCSPSKVKNAKGLTLTSGGYVIIYISPETFNWPTVAHESFHAADYVLDFTGMEHAPGGSNEHIAYLITWFAQRIEDSWHHYRSVTDV